MGFTYICFWDNFCDSAWDPLSFLQLLLPNNIQDTNPELIKIGYYFPFVTPHPASHAKSAYEIHINGRSLHAAEVSRLKEVFWDGKKRYLQTIFLEQAATFRLGEQGFVRGDQVPTQISFSFFFFFLFLFFFRGGSGAMNYDFLYNFLQSQSWRDFLLDVFS